MEKYYIIFAILVLLVIDRYCLKRQNRDLAQAAFHVSNKPLLIFYLAVFLGLFFSQSGRQALPFFVLCSVYPAHMIQRRRFMQKSSCQDMKLLLISDALGVILTWFFWAVMLSVGWKLLSYYIPGDDFEMLELIVFALYSSVMIMGLIVKASARFSAKGFLTNVGLVTKNKPLFQLVILPIMLGLIFAFFSTYIACERSVQPQTPMMEVLDKTEPGILLFLFVLLATFIAPFIEEVVFRGYFFTVIKRVGGQRLAIYVISLLFAFLHVHQYWGDWSAITMVAILGLSLTMLRAWLGTTVPSVILHYVYNMGVTFLPMLISISEFDDAAIFHLFFPCV